MCNIVSREKPKNVLISAAASQIGKMMIAQLRKNDPSLKIYGLNRSASKNEELKRLGANDVISIEDPPSPRLA